MKVFDMHEDKFNLDIKSMTETVPHDYKPYNLIKHSSLENLVKDYRYIYYMCNDWYNDGWCCGDGFKARAKVTDKFAHSGKHSLECEFRNLALQKVTKVKPETDYVFSFYYYIQSDENPAKCSKLDYIGVANPEAEVTACNGEWWKGKMFESIYFDGYEQDGIKTVYDKWQRVELRFNSKKYEKIKLAIKYSASHFETPPIYLDDLCLVEEKLIKDGEYDLDVAAGVSLEKISLNKYNGIGFEVDYKLNTTALLSEYPDYSIKEFGVTAEYADVLNGKPLTGFNHKLVLDNKDGMHEVLFYNISKKNFTKDIIVRPYFVLEGKEEKLLFGDEALIRPIELLLPVTYNKIFDEQATETKETIDEVYSMLSGIKHVELPVYNDKEYYSETIGPMNATVYHMTSYFDDDMNRKYTPAMIKEENRRIKDTGIKIVRTMFRSTWSVPEDEEFSGWNFESPQMLAFYKNCLDMQEIGVDVMITAGWLLDYYAQIKKEHIWYRDHPYLYGEGEDFYNENDGYDYSGDDEYHKRIKIASHRYGEWVCQALKAFKEHGVNNVKYVLCFTEPYAFMRTKEGDWMWADVQMIVGLNEMLNKYGLRDTVKIVGPNQSPCNIKNKEDLLLYYVPKHLPDTKMIDIYSDHSGRGLDPYMDMYSLVTDKVEYEYYYNFFKTMTGHLRDAGVKSDVFSDEFLGGSYRYPASLRKHLACHMLSGCVGTMQAKSMGICYWQYADQLWPNGHGNTVEMRNGFHSVGSMPSLLNSFTPHTEYYGLGIFTKYTKDMPHILDCNFRTDEQLYYLALCDDAGNMTVAVINTSLRPLAFDVEFKKDINLTFDRYCYDPENTRPDDRARLPKADKVIKCKNKLSDVIAPLGVTVYTTKKID